MNLLAVSRDDNRAVFVRADYLGADTIGTGKKVYYRAVYRDMTLYYSIGIDSTGKIASVLGEPDVKL